MIEAIRAEFMPRFRANAKQRIARARMLVGSGGSHALAQELHALAGEAAVMGVATLAEAARKAERYTRESVTTDEWIATLDQMARLLDEGSGQ
jgi:HPt (histidine-containing phosphotransfer) domain-containing protein